MEEQSLRLGAYCAAIDQEQAAASVYAQSIGELERWLERHGTPAANHNDGTWSPDPDPGES